MARFLPDLAGALQASRCRSSSASALTGVEVSRVGQYYSIFADLESACTSGATCISGVCLDGICQPPTCTDTVENGGETGGRLRRRQLSRLRDGRGLLPDRRTASTGGCSGGICQPPCTTRRAVSERRLHGRLLPRAELRRRRRRTAAETGIDCGGGADLSRAATPAAAATARTIARAASARAASASRRPAPTASRTAPRPTSTAAAARVRPAALGKMCTLQLRLPSTTCATAPAARAATASSPSA